MWTQECFEREVARTSDLAPVRSRDAPAPGLGLLNRFRTAQAEVLSALGVPRLASRTSVGCRERHAYMSECGTSKCSRFGIAPRDATHGALARG